MTSQMYIDAFADLGEPVLLQWLRNLKCDKNGDWSITALLKGLNTEKPYSKPVPFGLMPYLIPGRVFHDGRAGTKPEIGQLEFATIPALREYKIAKLRDIPASVFPQGRRWRSDEELYLYRTPELDLYIPPVELVRHLFLHEKILANAILRRGALAELCVPVRPDFYRNLELHFTAAIPVSVLTKEFVIEFAWLAAHPTGAKSWKSVVNLRNEKDGVRLYPPKIENSKMAFMGLIGDGAALVLEIIELPGKRDPFRWLTYTHPSLRKSDIAAPKIKGRVHKGKAGRIPKTKERDYLVQNGTSHVNSHPDMIDAQRIGNDFVGERGKIRRQYVSEMSEVSARTGVGYYGIGNNGAELTSDVTHREIVKVSVSDISLTPDLPPLAFRLLDPPPLGYVGELEPLMDTLKRMRELLPSTTKLASSLCALPDGKAISWTGRYRRPCLLATITPLNASPVVLLDIDHAGGISLSGLSLHFTDKAEPEIIENAVQLVLNSVTTSGHWPSDIETIGKHIFSTNRMKRMLRCKPRTDDPDYQTRWAAMLIDKLGLSQAS